MGKVYVIENDEGTLEVYGKSLLDAIDNYNRDVGPVLSNDHRYLALVNSVTEAVYGIDYITELPTDTRNRIETKEAAEDIENWIKARVEKGETYYCRFYMPKSEFKRYIEREFVQTTWEGPCNAFDVILPGTYNLKEDFYRSEILECIVEYSGVFPIKWTPLDNAYFMMLVHEEDIHPIVIRYDKDGNFVGMNWE